MAYALYKGEEVLGIGTLPQLASKFNLKIQTLQYYGTNAYKRKLNKRKNSKNPKILVNLADND